MRVTAIAKNDAGRRVREGLYPTDKDDDVTSFQLGDAPTLPFPRIQGADVVGRIAATDSGVDPARMGKRGLLDFNIYADTRDDLNLVPDYFGHGRDGGLAASTPGFAAGSTIMRATHGPFPRPSQPGMPLTGSPAALGRHIGRRLRTNRFLFVHDLKDRRREAMDMLMEEFDLEVPPEAMQGDTVLILTPRCRAELAEDPDLFLDRLVELHHADADTGVISLGAGKHAERFSFCSSG